MAKMIHGRNSDLFQALQKAGLADDMTRRVVIDIAVDNVVQVFIEKFADSRVINVVTKLEGIEIEMVTAPGCDNCSHPKEDHIPADFQFAGTLSPCQIGDCVCADYVEP